MNLKNTGDETKSSNKKTRPTKSSVNCQQYPIKISSKNINSNDKRKNKEKEKSVIIMSHMCKATVQSHKFWRHS